MEQRTTPARVEDGRVIIDVPNKRIARLVQLGVHAERAAKHRQMRRRMERASRRRNRRSQ